MPSVYEDHNPGSPVQVILQVGCSDEEAELEDVILGTLNIAPTLTWVTMDTKITEIFVVSFVNMLRCSYVVSFIYLLLKKKKEK